MICSTNPFDRIDLALLNGLQLDARQTAQQLAEAAASSARAGSTASVRPQRTPPG